MNIVENKIGDEIITVISGRNDTYTSVQVQGGILKAFQNTEKLTLDLKEVDYVSSAGLRAFLIAEKTAKPKKGKFVLKNVNDGVMQVLKMSGFAKILTIE